MNTAGLPALIFHASALESAPPPPSTSLQRGEKRGMEVTKPFQRFEQGVETAEAVLDFTRTPITSLKRGARWRRCNSRRERVKYPNKLSRR